MGETSTRPAQDQGCYPDLIASVPLSEPAALQELSSAWRKNPQRRRVEPTVTGPIGTPPKQTPLDFPAAWRYLVKCAPAGVLASRDRVWLEVAAHLLVQFRANPA